MGVFIVFCSNDFKKEDINISQNNIIGEKLIKDGEFHKALAYFKWGLAISSLISNNNLEIYIRSKLGIVYWEIGDIKNAEKQYNHMLRIVKGDKSNQEKEVMKCIEIIKLYTQGKKFRLMSKSGISIECFHKAIDISDSIDNKSFKLKCLRHLGITYWMKGDYQAFYNTNVEAILIAVELNNSKEIGNCLNHIGLFYWKVNDYSNALNFFNKALVITKKLNNKKEESILLNNISIIYKELGDYKTSLNCLMRSLFIEKNMKDDQATSMILNNIGVTLKLKALINEDKESLRMAHRYYWDALNLASRIKNIETEIRVLNNIGSIHQHMNEYEKAVYYFNKGLEKNRNLKNYGLETMLLNNLGIAYFHLNDLDSSKYYFVKAIALCPEEENKEILWEAYYGLGQIYDRLYEFHDAEKCYKKSIDLVDNIRSKINEDENKIGFARNKQNIYESLIYLIFNKNEMDSGGNRDSEIFSIIEKAKSRAFLESLKEAYISVNGNNRISSNIIIRERTNEISASIIELLNSKLDTKKIKLISKSIENELQYSNKAAISYRSEYSHKNKLNSIKPCSIGDVQKHLLDERTALMEYYLGEKNSYLLYITKSSCQIIRLLPRDRIMQSITAYLNLLSNPPKRKYAEFSAGQRICEEIFISNKIEIDNSINHIIIVPDGVLNYFPFETLIRKSGNPRNNRNYLVSKYSISYAPSASSLLFLMNRQDNNRHRKDLLAIGVSNNYKKVNNKNNNELDKLYRNQGYDLSPLSYCELEIKTIRKIFNDFDNDVFINNKASEGLIKKYLLNSYRIIHFACHGFLDQNFPNRSALLLSSNNNFIDDGYLQAREVYNIELNSDLVVLSACQTGKGKIEKGEGVIGFPRIFLLAGSKSVLSTLWKIEDKSTAKFMKYFYLQLKKGENKSEALRKAKILMINSKYSHPFYWAGFILNGEYSSPISFN